MAWLIQMNETITYGIKPVGQDAPMPERKIVKPNDKLRFAFEEFLDKQRRLISVRALNGEIEESTFSLLKDLPHVMAAELHWLMEEFKEHELFYRAGSFLSVAYNLICIDTVIVFDFDNQKLTNVAENLDRNKCFVNKGALGPTIGQSAKGIIINYGSGENFGFRAESGVLNYADLVDKNHKDTCLGLCGEITSVVINAGHVRKLCSEAHGIGINFNKCDVLGEKSSLRRIDINDGMANAIPNYSLRVICPQVPHIGYAGEHRTWIYPEEYEQMPALVQYIRDLKEKVEAGRNDVNAAVALMCSLSREKIEDDLERIIRSYGRWW